MTKLIPNKSTAFCVTRLWLVSSLCSVLLLLSACCHPDCNRSLIRVEPSTLDFAITGESLNAEVITTMCWKVISKPDWITSVTPNSGCGNTPIVVTAPATSKGREGKIIFLADNGDRAELIVKQGMGDVPPTDDPTVYVAGHQYFDETTTATLWKNGVPYLLSSDGLSYAAAVYVTESGTEYVAGTNNGVATLWKNGVPQAISSNPSGASCMWVTEEGAIYVVGSELGEPTVWKVGGTKQTLPAPPSPISFDDNYVIHRLSISVAKDGTVYVAGTIVWGSSDAESTEYMSCLWSGGSLEILYHERYAPDASSTSANSVYATEEGSFTAGHIHANSSSFFRGFTLWKNGVLRYSDPGSSLTSLRESKGNSVYITKEGTEYVAGHYNRGYSPCLWIDGALQPLLLTDSDISSAQACSIYIAGNGVIYVAGQGNNSSSAVPLLWIDGEQQTLPVSPGAYGSFVGRRSVRFCKIRA